MKEQTIASLMVEVEELRRENARLREAVEQVLKDVGDRLTGKTVLMLRAALAGKEVKHE